MLINVLPKGIGAADLQLGSNHTCNAQFEDVSTRPWRLYLLMQWESRSHKHFAVLGLLVTFAFGLETTSSYACTRLCVLLSLWVTKGRPVHLTQWSTTAWSEWWFLSSNIFDIEAKTIKFSRCVRNMWVCMYKWTSTCFHTIEYFL